MLSTESTLVRAFTRRRAPDPRPPAPAMTLDAFHRRQAALRQMGLLPGLSLSQQEAQLDSFIPPSSPVRSDSEADRIKHDWVVRNAGEEEVVKLKLDFATPLPSPPLTPLAEDTPTLKPLVIAPDITLPLVQSPAQDCQPHSPVSAEFHPLLPSRSPSLDSNSTAASLPVVTRPDPPSRPPPLQRKKTVFARFRRATTVDPSSVSRLKDPHAPSRSKSLFASVRKTVFAFTGGAGPTELHPIATSSSAAPPSTTPPPEHKPDLSPEAHDPAKVDLDSDSNHPESTPSAILNRERTKSPSSSSPSASPRSSLLSPPASPTGPRLRGRLGRRGTIGSGTGLLSVWGGVAGLLGGGPAAPSIATASGSDEDGEVRQAVAPTIHNEASISLHMSNIEDEETRRVTELAFM